MCDGQLAALPREGEGLGMRAGTSRGGGKGRLKGKGGSQRGGGQGCKGGSRARAEAVSPGGAGRGRRVGVR